MLVFKIIFNFCIYEYCVVYVSSNFEMSIDILYYFKNIKYILYGINNIKIENFEWWF